MFLKGGSLLGASGRQNNFLGGNWVGGIFADPKFNFLSEEIHKEFSV